MVRDPAISFFSNDLLTATFSVVSGAARAVVHGYFRLLNPVSRGSGARPGGFSLFKTHLEVGYRVDDTTGENLGVISSSTLSV